MTRPWITKGKVKHHDELKHQLLDYIESSPAESHTNVSKVDFKTNNNRTPPYHNIVKTAVLPTLVEAVERYGFKVKKAEELVIKPMWFQQYEQGSDFNWHNHDKTVAFVYYTELPEGDQLTTEFFDPWTGEIFTVDAEEGDVVVFPSFVMHNSPVNRTGLRKTVFAGNVQVLSIPNEQFIESHR